MAYLFGGHGSLKAQKKFLRNRFKSIRDRLLKKAEQKNVLMVLKSAFRLHGTGRVELLEKISIWRLPIRH